MNKRFILLAAAAAVFAAPLRAASSDSDFEAQVEQAEQAARAPASVKDWFKSAADKASDAEKLEFMRSEGENVDDGYAVTENGSTRLSDKGAAVFGRMKAAFNEQSSLLAAGWQKVSPEEARALEAVERVVNLKIVRMREACRSMDMMSNGNALSFSCSFVTDVSYVRLSGRSRFVSREGSEMLQALSGAIAR